MRSKYLNMSTLPSSLVTSLLGWVYTRGTGHLNIRSAAPGLVNLWKAWKLLAISPYLALCVSSICLFPSYTLLQQISNLVKKNQIRSMYPHEFFHSLATPLKK